MIDLQDLKTNLIGQDNRCTADPLFIVQQQKIIYGLDREYTDNFCWIDEDGESILFEGDDGYKDLEDKMDPICYSGERLDGYRRVGYIETWEFVTACFTEQGCKDYIKWNGHNLHEPRIYVASAYRNREWIELREYFLKLE